jgi:broad specificity phosphatase PhoE
MIEIYLIRHGQASFGQPTYDCLSMTGQRQAALLGRYFYENGTRFDALYSGALKRHVQTATIAMNQMNGDGGPRLIIDADFNELDSSDRMMNRLFSVFQEDAALSEQVKHIHTDHGAIGRIFDIAEKAAMLPGDQAARIRLAQRFRQRISGALDNLVRRVGDNKKVAVFTSGGPTAVALQQTLDTSREQAIRLAWDLRNTSITVLRYDQARLGLVLFNCVAHLEAQNDPQLITYI